MDTPRALVRENLFLVCRIYRIGTLNPDPKAKTNLAQGAQSIGDVQDNQIIFRRPFGVGAVNLAQLEVHGYEHGKENEQTIMLFKTCNTEGHGFPNLHYHLMRNGNRAQDGVAETIPQCTGVVVGLGVFDGLMDDLMKFETLKPFDEKKDLKITRRAQDKKMEVRPQGHRSRRGPPASRSRRARLLLPPPRPPPPHGLPLQARNKIASARNSALLFFAHSICVATWTNPPLPRSGATTCTSPW